PPALVTLSLHDALPILQARVADAQLIASPLPDLPLKLWLIDPSTMQRPFSAEETQRLLDEPPYWCFCWASGLALAQWILQHPEQDRKSTRLNSSHVKIS